MTASTSQSNSPKVALVYDHLTTSYGGAELVLQVLHEIFPNAPLYTTVHNVHKAHWAHAFNIHKSFLQRFPVIKFKHQLLAPLHPLAFECFDFSAFDVVISITSGAAKGVLTTPKQLHVCYLLTPTRYLQAKTPQQNHYVKTQKIFLIPGLLQFVTPVFEYLKRWDRAAAWRPDVLIAISQLVSDRSEETYNRAANAIIYPPFIPNSQTSTLHHSEFFLTLTRLVTYKNIENAVKAALETQTLLVVAGDGPHKNNLIKVAGKNALVRNPTENIDQVLATAQSHKKLIVFMGSCTEKEKHTLLAHCKALVMPGEEDFGLTGLEAAAHGKPVITNKKSGIAEVLADPAHALHLETGSVAEISQAFKRTSKKQFNSKKLQRVAEKYDAEHFKKQFQTAIYHLWQQHSTISPVQQSDKVFVK